MNRAMVALIALGVVVVGHAEDIQPARRNIGHLVSESEASASELSVLPDGTGLPAGRGTSQQGKALYVQHCAACHGDRGEGRADFPALVGGRGSLISDKPVLTVGSYWPYATTIFDYVRRGMPYDSPGSLNDDEVYALTAWILHANDVIGEKSVMDRQTLPKVKMPNRDGFIADPRPDVAHDSP